MKYFQNISNLWGNVLTALGNTVYISLIAIVLGTILGIAMGVVLTYCKKRRQWLFRIYVDIMRGLPVLVTISPFFRVATTTQLGSSTLGRDRRFTSTLAVT